MTGAGAPPIDGSARSARPASRVVAASGHRQACPGVRLRARLRALQHLAAALGRQHGAQDRARSMPFRRPGSRTASPSSNFIAVFHNESLIRAFLNTLLIASATTAVAVVVGVLGGYGFSRYRIPGRKSPAVVGSSDQALPPRRRHRSVLCDPAQPPDHEHVPGPGPRLPDGDISGGDLAAQGLLRQIPVEIEEAAIVDGCSVPQLLWLIVLPMARPALVAVAMYSFILAWNEFLFALVFTNGLERRPLSVALAFFIDENGIQWGELMAASIVMSLPADSRLQLRAADARARPRRGGRQGMTTGPRSPSSPGAARASAWQPSPPSRVRGISVVAGCPRHRTARRDDRLARSRRCGPVIAARRRRQPGSRRPEPWFARHRPFGRMDVLVNCAGVSMSPAPRLADTTCAEWHRIIDTNLTGTYLMCRAALQHLGSLPTPPSSTSSPPPLSPASRESASMPHRSSACAP